VFGIFECLIVVVYLLVLGIDFDLVIVGFYLGGVIVVLMVLMIC